MKKHSRSLLLALAGESLQKTGIPLTLALQLPIGETPAGKRSLIYYLARENQVWLERHLGMLAVGITTQGSRRLKAEFPALSVTHSSAEPDWQLIVLKQAPKNDPHFRSLATLCAKYRVLRLARGVYAYPGLMPTALEMQLSTLYAESNLARATVKEWVSGLDRPVIVSYYDIENLSDIYSSVSKEIEQLLSINSKLNVNVYQSISSICSLINRLESALIGDCGLVNRYFPETPLALDLVNQLARVLKTLSQPE